MPELLTSDPDSNRDEIHHGKVGKCKKLHPERVHIGDYGLCYECNYQFNHNDEFKIMADAFSFQRNPTSRKLITIEDVYKSSFFAITHSCIGLGLLPGVLRTVHRFL